MDSLDELVQMDELPALLTVEEAGHFLTIGRSLAYRLAHEYLESGGTIGLPVIRIGGCLRAPRWSLIVFATTGRVVRLCDAEVPWFEVDRVE